MKKAISLALSLALSAALAVPAFAAEFFYPGDADLRDVNYGYRDQTQSQSSSYDIIPEAEQGYLNSDVTRRFGVNGAAVLADAFLGVAPTAPANVPDAFYYVVNPGDTLDRIAYLFYDDPAAADALYRANANGHFLASNGVLEAWRDLRLPTDLEGKWSLLWDADAAGNTWAVLRNTVYVDTAKGEADYVVQAGDTLASIAQKFYGDAKFWEQIAADKRNKNWNIPDPTNLYAGQYIVLPVIYIGY